jgi:hypothetical protein
MKSRLYLAAELQQAAVRENKEHRHGQTPWWEEDAFYARAVQFPELQRLVEEALESHNWSRVCE